MEDKTRSDYRNQILRIITFLQKECPGYYYLGVVKVSKSDQQDPSKCFFGGHFKFDLRYEWLNPHYVLYYLNKTKRKKDGKIKSVTDIRKYKDAIMWGVEMKK